MPGLGRNGRQPPFGRKAVEGLVAAREEQAEHRLLGPEEDVGGVVLVDDRGPHLAEKTGAHGGGRLEFVEGHDKGAISANRHVLYQPEGALQRVGVGSAVALGGE